MTGGQSDADQISTANTRESRCRTDIGYRLNEKTFKYGLGGEEKTNPMFRIQEKKIREDRPRIQRRKYSRERETDSD